MSSRTPFSGIRGTVFLGATCAVLAVSLVLRIAFNRAQATRQRTASSLVIGEVFRVSSRHLGWATLSTDSGIAKSVPHSEWDSRTCRTLIFFSPTCPYCDALASEMGRARAAGVKVPPIVWVSRWGLEPDLESFARRHGLESPMALLSLGDKSAGFPVQGVPTVVTLTSQGVVSAQQHDADVAKIVSSRQACESAGSG